MKRADLETFLGKMVELKLFDGSVIRGCLRKTQDETFKGRKKKTRSKQNSRRAGKLYLRADLCSRYCGEVCG